MLILMKLQMKLSDYKVIPKESDDLPGPHLLASININDGQYATRFRAQIWF